MPRVHFEQAVYGSFPFCDKGYTVLAQSPGCNPELIENFARICQQFGEPRGRQTGEGALFCRRVPKQDIWLIVGVASAGFDDRGRPGALSFHGLFLTDCEFAKIGYDPFQLVPHLASDWSAETTLDAVDANLIAVSNEKPHLRAQPYAATLLHEKCRVAVVADAPINELAKVTWKALTIRERRQRSFATYSFRHPSDFDLVGAPRTACEELNDTVAILTPEEAAAITMPKDRRKLLPFALVLIACLIGSIAIVGKSWKPTTERGGKVVKPYTNGAEVKFPGISDDDERPIDPDERLRIVEGLVELVERFPVRSPNSSDPTTLMSAFSEQLRYRGPRLTVAEREQLQATQTKESKEFIEWDDRIKLFCDDRSLPSDFAHRPLRWQLFAFAWSFHLDVDLKYSVAEIPQVVADNLSISGSIPAELPLGTPSTLVEYHRFLRGLPRQ